MRDGVVPMWPIGSFRSTKVALKSLQLPHEDVEIREEVWVAELTTLISCKVANV